jgi:hypothetical protein
MPVCASTTPAVNDAIRTYQAGDLSAGDTILAKAERVDAIVLLALAAIDPARRTRAFEKLAELSPPPDVEVTAETVLTNAEHLALWQQDILEIYFGLFGPDATVPKEAPPSTPTKTRAPTKAPTIEKVPPVQKTPVAPFDDGPFETPRKTPRKTPSP